MMQFAPVLVLGLLFGSGGLLGEATDTVDSALPLGDRLAGDAILGSLADSGYRANQLQVELQILDGERVSVRLPDAGALDPGDLRACVSSNTADAAACIDQGLLLQDPAVVQALLGSDDPTLRLLCPRLETEPCRVPLWLLLQNTHEDPNEEGYNPYTYTGGEGASAAPGAEDRSKPLPVDAPILVGAAVPILAIAIAAVPWSAAGGAALEAGRRVPVWARYLGAAALYSRITDDDLLENETRAKVTEFVEEHPGASIQDIQEAAGVAWGTAIYHLARLERHGKMVSLRDGNFRRYWVSGTTEARRREALAVLRTDVARQLALAVHRNPGIKQKELCEKIGIRNPVASKYLKRLAEQKLVRDEPQGRFRCYYPTQTMAKILESGTVRPNVHSLDGGEEAGAAA